MTSNPPVPLDEFAASAREWLATMASPRSAAQWGVGPDSVAVFENWTATEERVEVAHGHAVAGVQDRPVWEHGPQLGEDLALEQLVGRVEVLGDGAPRGRIRRNPSRGPRAHPSRS